MRTKTPRPPLFTSGRTERAKALENQPLCRWHRSLKRVYLHQSARHPMKDSRSGLLPDHTVINYNTSSISLAAREAST